MSILIKSVTLTPNELYIGQSFKISVKVEDTSWDEIKNNFNNWQSIKDEFSNWDSVKNLQER